MNMLSAPLHRRRRHTGAARKCFLAPLRRPPQIVAHTRTRTTSQWPTCRTHHSPLRFAFALLLLRSSVYRLLLCILFLFFPQFIVIFLFFFCLKHAIHFFLHTITALRTSLCCSYYSFHIFICCFVCLRSQNTCFCAYK